MRNTIIFLGACLALSIAAPSFVSTAPFEGRAERELERELVAPPVVEPVFAADQAIAQVRMYYRNSLLDYGSAQFEWGTFTGTELVFYVNARNTYGGYTGRRRMVAIFEGGKLKRIAG
jgi:hypothetical protein